MNITACVKQVPDTGTDRELRPDDGTVARDAVDTVINELDEFAIEEGLRLAEKHGGAITVRSRVRAGVPIIAVRPGAVAAEPAPVPGPAVLEPADITVSDAAKAARVTERVHEERGSRPELTEAAVVISGGRGVVGDLFNVVPQLTGEIQRRAQEG